MMIFREETFGPVAPVFRFKTEEEAIRLANDTEFGARPNGQWSIGRLVSGPAILPQSTATPASQLKFAAWQ